MNSNRFYLIGDLNSDLTTSEKKEIINEQNKTLSHFIIKVDDKDASVVINIDNVIRWNITSIEKMYDDGLVLPMYQRPYLLTYDTTNNVYVLIFEPREVIPFKKFSVSIIPSGSNMTYSYEGLFLKPSDE